MNGPESVPIKVVKREIAFSANACHNNIVKLLDVFAEQTQLVIVWELISGTAFLLMCVYVLEVCSNLARKQKQKNDR